LRPPSWNGNWAGKEAFTNAQYGYRRGKIFGRVYPAHQIIWVLQTGEWPAKEIDHIDGNSLNNSWSNLRAATRHENMRNTKSREGSSSKYLGVTFHKTTGKWYAKIGGGNKGKHLGTFLNEEEAALAYDMAAANQYGEFARLNFPTHPKEKDHE
jgi:hypothetical protein